MTPDQKKTPVKRKPRSKENPSKENPDQKKTRQKKTPIKRKPRSKENPSKENPDQKKTRRTHIGDPALEKSKPNGVNHIDESKPDEAKAAATKKNFKANVEKILRKKILQPKVILVGEFTILLPLLSKPGASQKNRFFPSGN